MSPHLSQNAGASLVELLVAITLLVLAGTGALVSLLLAERLGRRAAAGAATDRLRWETVQGAAAAPVCRAAPTPQAITLSLPATPERAPLAATIRCGP